MLPRPHNSTPFTYTTLFRSSVNDEIIMFAKQNEQFEVTSETEEWYEIVTDQGTGYIFKKLIDQNQSDVSNHLQGKTIVIDAGQDRKSTRLNSSHVSISYAVL